LALAVAGLAGAAILPFRPADAHGGLTFPATRTYACYEDGLAGGGDLNPTNPTCIAALEAGGKQPLWDWFGNLLPDVGDRHREAIPDGRLCGPGEDFAAYNMARTDWPTTRLTPGETITMRYNAWAPHPDTWSQYITRDGWDPSKPLGWGDLEPAPFDEVTNPPINSSGPHGAEYDWRAALPSNKSGRHIIFSIWERSDSPEAFYNCSDVDFGGSGTPNPTPTTPPTTPPPTTPPTTPPAPRPPTGPGACEVEVDVATTWSGGYVAHLQVTNSGSRPIDGWHVELDLGGSGIGNSWSGEFEQSGDDVTIMPMSWNTNLAPNATASPGFVGTGEAPSSFAATCTPMTASDHQHHH
jgi:predicted carbohydrate-binding protein with CBM5 and CBM33 domain